ncbi:amidohydrolase 3 [Lasiosphaeria ovina]|uniref:Amidohydrolase 3 n=1 Tax=Lasiosphaeria ovina TaxID=92902 RepID=A0AAE0JWV5_9PEZI|nr:amidohydrolase 3 [Lasiosphaeria ovina]
MQQTGDDVSVYAGTIITMAAGNFSPEEAMAIKGDTIIAIGTTEAVDAAVSSMQHTKRDLGTQCIMPGFVEPHVHLLLSSLVGKGSPVIDMSYSAVKKRHKAVDLIKKSPHYGNPCEWIIGCGYDPSLVEAHEQFKLDDLDCIAPLNPVFILNQSGHLAYVNSRAFKWAKIGITNCDANFPECDPNYEKNDSGTALDGVLKEGAVTTVAKSLPQSPFMIDNLAATLKGWAKNGCTTVFDCGLGSISGSYSTEISWINSKTAGGKFPRLYGAVAIQAITDLQQFIDSQQPPWDSGSIRVQAVKFWLDGSTQGFTAAVSKPYLNPPKGWPPCGPLNYPCNDEKHKHDDDEKPTDDEKTLQGYVTPLVKAGWQMVLHANGSRAVEQGLRVLGKALAASGDIVKKPNFLHRLEHVTADITTDQLRAAATMGLAVSHLVAHIRTWGYTFRTWVLGAERAARLDPVRDDVDLGVTYSFHSDSPVSEAEPLQYVDTAVTRQMANGCGVLGKCQTVSLEEGFRGITYNPAKKLGALADIGSLEVGKKADFVVLGIDPRLVHEGLLRSQCSVLETWVGGVEI